METLWQKEKKLKEVQQEKMSLVQSSNQMQEGLKDQIEQLKKSTDEAKDIAEKFEFQKNVEKEVKSLEASEGEVTSKEESLLKQVESELDSETSKLNSLNSQLS